MIAKRFPDSDTGRREDGRAARGAVRRRALIDATLAVLARGGVGGVTHRAVAGEAGVAAASVRYPFGTIDELLIAAITSATAEWADGMDEVDRGAFAALLDGVCLHGLMTDDPRAFAALLDGVCLHGLMTDDPPDAAEIEAVLRRLAGPAAGG